LKSSTLNVNFFEKAFGKKQSRIVTGAGFSFNYYRFNAPWTPTGEQFSGFKYDTLLVGRKIKLVTSSLAVPLMLQLNSSKNKREAVRLSVGVIGYYRFATALKIKNSGERSEKSITRNDYGLERLRCDATLRIGYKRFYAFVNYGLTNMFGSKAFDATNNQQGDNTSNIAKLDVRPLTIGISLVGL
jgi:hypothetical protein